MEYNGETQRAINSLQDLLVQNEQALTTRERALLIDLLCVVRENGGSSSMLDKVVAERMTSAIRGTILQRLGGGAIGNTIVQQVLSTEVELPAVYKDITVPRKLENSLPLSDIRDDFSFAVTQTDLSLQFVILEEFLVREELEGLMEFVLKQQGAFQTTKVLSSNKNEGVIDYEHRRSHVLFDLGKYEALITNRVLTFLPHVLRKLKYSPFPVSRVEAQLTATNDGEYFRIHNDNTHEVLREREITYVYYFYREPKPFTGGDLKLYESSIENSQYRAKKTFKTIEPQQNQVVFFPSFLMHEVTPVCCPSRLFADSRFTVNGWIHKQKRL